MDIEVNDLSKVFRIRNRHFRVHRSDGPASGSRTREIRAVDHVSFSIERGEAVAFLGPNGAGKSTTIKLLTGILAPTAGNVLVLNKDPYRSRRKVAYDIGTVFGQKSQLWFNMPPYDSLRLLAHIYDMPRDRAERRIAYLSELFEIQPYLSTPVRVLSLGERIRCELAASLLHQPRLVLLDEPTIGLDVVVRQKVRDLICRINMEEKVTVFLTSHDVGDVEKICKRAIVMNRGRIIWDDRLAVMKRSFLHRKIIDLKLATRLALAPEGLGVLETTDYSARLEVNLDERRIEDVITEILRRNHVIDISISDPSMEEVIALIFRNATR